MNDFCNQFNLDIAGGTESQANQDNYTYRSSLGTLRRIDFILFSAGLDLRNFGTNSDIDLGSDHRSLRASFGLIRPLQQKLKNRKDMKGWLPTFDNNGRASRYHQILDDKLSDLENPEFHQIEKILYDSASQSSKMNDKPNIR